MFTRAPRRLAATCLAVAALASACGSAAGALDAAPTPPSPALERLADEVMRPAIDPAGDDLERCIGAVAIVVTPDARLARGYGATTRGGARVPDADTLFQLGSLSKVYTGLALAREIAAGRLTPGTPVGTRLGTDLAGVLDGGGPTLEALISHHGGLPHFPDNLTDRDADGVQDAGIDWRSPATGYGRSDLAAYLSAWTPASTGYGYSNVGIGLVGVALADHLGLSGAHAMLRALVLDDLGLCDTYGEVAALDGDARERVAEGVALKGQARVAGMLGQMGVLASAGEVVASGADVARLLATLTGAQPGPLDDAVAVALSPLGPGEGDFAIGYAIDIETRPDRVVYRKVGLTSSYSAYLMFTRTPAVGVAVLASCGGFTRVKPLAEALFDGVLGSTE